ncbi:hypothetical protein IscW_ISCW009348 [Ixodes scapularis]|uniref:Uncharacterized protein n=1 Tax=Ixodes scapularis TaxID=6945 RepID=B7Q0C7_IXOSC|nr:hypothetical protein IscW_ISCW009348 [Ixodes scapularis]|eukprot:XP_002407437.1 hypothetical protein IscW_ISCW009348 [Ixodes scapularis]
MCVFRPESRSLLTSSAKHLHKNGQSKKKKKETGMFKAKSKYSFYILPAPSKGSGMSESHHSKRGALKQLTLVHTHSCPYAPHMCTKDQNRCYVTGLLEYTHSIYKLSTQTGER